MDMNMHKITLLCGLLLVSCTSPAPVKSVEESVLTDFPVKPSLIVYTNPPVVKKVDNNFLVTEELITNATLLTDYYKRLEAWKITKKIQ